MLGKVVKPKLLGIFVGIVTFGIIVIGYLFNAFGFGVGVDRPQRCSLFVMANGTSFENGNSVEMAWLVLDGL